MGEAPKLERVEGVVKLYEIGLRQVAFTQKPTDLKRFKPPPWVGYSNRFKPVLGIFQADSRAFTHECAQIDRSLAMNDF